ncbi:Uncharacterized protein TCM_041065 [Theobroma cacao]|uniref:Uncharacterized protein n=1 Tax=Theobroma cacao TaxID=3641 RepID=A0A061GUG5_THECC|nr:Uncharacterized protein TCM_041065 [Theobroma cacao]
MDLQSSPPFQGKTQASKPRAVGKPAHASKANAKEPQVSRNPNIPAKTVPDKPKKPSILDKKTEPKSSKSINIASNPPEKSKAQNLNEPETPVGSTSSNKPRIIRTPCHSAENCYKCQFDGLKTASYVIKKQDITDQVMEVFVDT